MFHEWTNLPCFNTKNPRLPDPGTAFTFVISFHPYTVSKLLLFLDAFSFSAHELNNKKPSTEIFSLDGRFGPLFDTYRQLSSTQRKYVKSGKEAGIARKVKTWSTEKVKVPRSLTIFIFGGGGVILKLYFRFCRMMSNDENDNDSWFSSSAA